MEVRTGILKEYVLLLLTAFVLAVFTLPVSAITFPATGPPPVSITKKTPLDKQIELPININSADAKTLMLVPGINRTAARQIVNHRSRRGKYSGLDEIIGFSGISENSIKQLQKYLVVR